MSKVKFSNLHISTLTLDQEKSQQTAITTVLNNKLLLCEHETLLSAIVKGTSNDVYYLLLKGVSPNIPPNILQIAITKKDMSVIRFLLRHGSNPNYIGADNMSSMHMAAINGDMNLLRTLIHNGGDSLIKNKMGYTLLHMAAIGLCKGNQSCWKVITFLFTNYARLLDPYALTNKGVNAGNIISTCYKYSVKYWNLLETHGF